MHVQCHIINLYVTPKRVLLSWFDFLVTWQVRLAEHLPAALAIRFALMPSIVDCAVTLTFSPAGSELGRLLFRRFHNLPLYLDRYVAEIEHWILLLEVLSEFLSSKGFTAPAVFRQSIDRLRQRKNGVPRRCDFHCRLRYLEVSGRRTRVKLCCIRGSLALECGKQVSAMLRHFAEAEDNL